MLFLPLKKPWESLNIMMQLPELNNSMLPITTLYIFQKDMKLPKQFTRNSYNLNQKSISIKLKIPVLLHVILTKLQEIVMPHLSPLTITSPLQ